MSIERAIEIIEELGNFKNTKDEYHNGIMRGYWSAIQILKEEAEPPCERCKHWLSLSGCWKEDGQYCRHFIECPDLFEPKEADETEAH